MTSLKFYLLSTLCISSHAWAMLDEVSDHFIYYEDILEAQKDRSILIIDIRNDTEVREIGILPGSIHIPMSQVVDVLTKYSNEEFERQYHRDKPTFETKIILSCLKGLRSGKLLPELLELGYKNTYSYAGGFLDWEKHQQHQY